MKAVTKREALNGKPYAGNPHVAVSGCYIHMCRKPHTYNGDGLDIDAHTPRLH